MSRKCQKIEANSIPRLFPFEYLRLAALYQHTKSTTIPPAKWSKCKSVKTYKNPLLCLNPGPVK